MLFIIVVCVCMCMSDRLFIEKEQWVIVAIVYVCMCPYVESI